MSNTAKVIVAIEDGQHVNTPSPEGRAKSLGEMLYIIYHYQRSMKGRHIGRQEMLQYKRSRCV